MQVRCPGQRPMAGGGESFTTTDAQIISGKIHPDYFLGGEYEPDCVSMEKASRSLCKSLNCSIEVLAKGIIRIANANMVNALKLISVNKGHDPRDFSMVVIGGGGAMHGADLARELEISELIIPQHAGVFSAFGMLMSDIRRDYIRTNVITLHQEQRPIIQSTFKEMENEAIENYKNDGYDVNEIKFIYYADLRYTGQEHYVKVMLPDFNENLSMDHIMYSFHREHKRQYSFNLDAHVELVSFHLVAVIEVEKPEFPKMEITGKSVEDALFDNREVDFDDLGICRTNFYHRDLLEPDMVIDGPAIIAEKATTTVVTPLHVVKVDAFGNLILTLKKA